VCRRRIRIVTFIRFLKSVLVVFTLACCSYFFVLKDRKQPNYFECPQIAKDNRVDGFSFRTQTSLGHLTVFAKTALMKEEKIIVLEEVSATLQNKEDVIKADAQKCTADFKQKKVFLSGQVNIKTKNEYIETERAVVDIKKETVTSDSSVKGKKGDYEFEAEGFSIDKKANASFKKVKIFSTE
jgi:LPS export ABC transporter protein LptC